MIHNSVKGFADVLQHFAAFFLQLKVVEMALKHKGRCERICATCLRGTPYAKHIDAFMIFLKPFMNRDGPRLPHFVRRVPCHWEC